MAKITFGNGIANIRGSIAGNTYSANANGAYIRRRSKPTNPNTMSQQNVRQIFNSIAAAWRALTSGQQGSFITQAPNYPYQDRLGQTKQYTGFQLYMKLNSALLQNGEATINTAQPPAGTLAPALLNVDYSASTFTLTAGLYDSSGTEISTIPTGYAVTIQATQGFGNGKYRPKQSDYRNIKVYPAGHNLSTPDNITAAYEAVFGTPATDSIVWFNMRVINTNTGELQTAIFSTNQVWG